MSHIGFAFSISLQKPSAMTLKRIELLLNFTLLNLLPICAQSPIRTWQVEFANGSSSKVIQGTIKGSETVDYVVHATAGQLMKVALKSNNGANYFNVLPPGESDVAIFVGSTSGDKYEGVLPAAGDYKIRVYLMRSAARRNEKASYTLTITLSRNS